MEDWETGDRYPRLTLVGVNLRLSRRRVKLRLSRYRLMKGDFKVSRGGSAIVTIRRAIACSWRAWHEVPEAASDSHSEFCFLFSEFRFLEGRCPPLRQSSSLTNASLSNSATPELL
jgi:hypothetical protein